MDGMELNRRSLIRALLATPLAIKTCFAGLKERKTADPITIGMPVEGAGIAPGTLVIGVNNETVVFNSSQAALREYEAARLFFDQTPDPVILIGPFGIIRKCDDE